MIIIYIQRLPAALHHHGRYNDTAGHTHHVRPPAHGVHPGDDDDGYDDGDGVEINLMEKSIMMEN